MNRMAEIKYRAQSFGLAARLEDTLYLLSIIEQAEKSLEKIFKNAYLDHLGDVSLLMLQMSGNFADEALKAIRGN